MGISIAIDGYAGSGKSTLAKQLAQKLGYVYLDTGALYRAITLKIIATKGIEYVEKLCAEKDIKKILRGTSISIEQRTEGNKVLLDGKNVSESIREPYISNFVSKIAAFPAVRKFLLTIQRSIARAHDCVMDGRDIGTAVLPHANYKFFVSAHINTRAQRRWLELSEKKIPISLEEVKKNLEERDIHDTSRSANPLRKAKNAVFIDSTHLTPETQLRVVLDVIARKKWESSNKIYNIYKSILKTFYTLVCRIEFYYEDYKVIESFSGLIVSNHISNLDPPAAGFGFPFQINFLAKSSLRSSILNPCNLILIDRDNPTPGTIKDVLQAVSEGQSVLLFPEGTRSPDGSIGTAKSGAGLIAHKAEKPIIPVYIEGTNHVLPKGAKFPRFHKVRVGYGKPYMTAIKEQKGTKSRELYQQISEEMLDRIRDVQYKLENNLLTKK